MTYAYEFTKPALKQFQRLEPWLGEETLDELEIVASNPQSIRQRTSTGFVHDFVRTRGASTVYVFLTIILNPAEQRLRVVNVGVFARASAQ